MPDDTPRRASPPGALRRLLARSLPPEDRASLRDELDALYAEHARQRGTMAATAWYARQTAGFVVRLGVGNVAAAFGGIDGLLGDARRSLRSFGQRPAFALTFAITLAIGTGVVATVYAAARWLLLRPVPGVVQPDQLAVIRLGSSEAPPHVSWALSHPAFRSLRDGLPAGGAVAAMTPIDVDLRPRGGAPRRAKGALVTTNYFDVLGARIASGRGFLPDEDERVVGEPVAVISEALARRLAPDGGAVGSEITINGTLVRVVGVAARDFEGATLPDRDALWLPLSALRIVDPATAPDTPLLASAGIWRLVIARRPIGTTMEALDAGMRLVESAIRTELRPAWALHQRLESFPGIGLDPAVRASARRTLTQLGAIAVLLFGLALANLINLALIESTRRAPLIALRAALGAGRARLVSGALVETMLLATGASVLAIGLALLWMRWSAGVQLAVHGAELGGMRLDVQIVAVTLVAALVAATVAFVHPVTASRVTAIGSLLRRRRADARSGHTLRAALVAIQVALSIVLLVTAGLMGRTVAKLRDVDLGFSPDRLLTFSLDPHLHGYESGRLEALAREAEARLREEAGIRSAGFVSPAPLRGGYWTAALFHSSDPDAQPLIAAGFYVTPGFLEALGVRVIAGETTWRADSGTAVITRGTLARMYPGLPPDAAIGRLVPTRANGQRPVRIAGVVEDVHLSDITNEAPPVVFRPLAERFAGMPVMGVVATASAPARQVPAVHRVLGAVAPELPLFDIRTARAAIDLQFADRHALARVAATLGVVGLVLAAVGLYGVLAAAVAARRREIGIRAALGAAPRHILGRLFLRGLVPVFAGLPLGLLAASLLSKLLAPQLFGHGALDPLTYAGATALLVLSATAVSLFPALRATRVPPTEVLRED